MFSLLSLSISFGTINIDVSYSYVPMKVSVAFSSSVYTLPVNQWFATTTMLPTPNKTFISVGRHFELSKSPGRQGGRGGVMGSAATNI